MTLFNLLLSFKTTCAIHYIFLQYMLFPTIPFVPVDDCNVLANLLTMTSIGMLKRAAVGFFATLHQKSSCECSS